MVSLDERLVEYEVRQKEDQDRNIQIAVDDLRQESARELILRYDEDTDVKLEIAGNTLNLIVQRDSIVVDEITTVEQDGLLEELETIEIEETELEPTWFSNVSDILTSTNVLAGVLIGILVVIMILYFIKKNREDEVVGDFSEDFEDLLEDEEEYLMAQDLESRDK